MIRFTSALPSAVATQARHQIAQASPRLTGRRNAHVVLGAPAVDCKRRPPLLQYFAVSAGPTVPYPQGWRVCDFLQHGSFFFFFFFFFFFLRMSWDLADTLTGTTKPSLAPRS